MDLWDEAAQACELNLHLLRKEVAAFRILNPAIFEQAAQSTTRQLAFSIARTHGQTPERAARYAEWALNCKGLHRESYEARLRSFLYSNDPPEYRLARLWSRYRAELASLAMTPPDTTRSLFEQTRTTQRVLELLDSLKSFETTAGQDSRPQWTDEMFAAVPDSWTTLTSLRDALPSNAVFINLCLHRACDFTKSGDEAWLPTRVAAFIIPAAGRGDVKIVDLGDFNEFSTAAYEAWCEASNPAALASPSDKDRPGNSNKPPQAVESWPAGTRLRKMALEPLRPYLGDAEHLIISPDGDLWRIPWAALPLEDGRYLVEKYRVSYSFGGRELVAAEADAASAKGAVVFGAPNYDQGRAPLDRSARLFKPLPGAAEEVQSIGPHLATYCGEPPRILTGDDATSAAFNEVHCPAIVVFSTHGFCGITLPQKQLSDDPLLNSGLAMAGANCRGTPHSLNGPDGILTAQEVVTADLRGTDLAVLSACETGRGQATVSEGLRGLQQAFHMAGARSVLATQWSIPDRETSSLMSEFFSQLAAGHDKAAALRNAQVAMIEARRKAGATTHPVLWAAFILSGQWQSRRPDPNTALPAKITEPDEDRDIASIEPTKFSNPQCLQERIVFTRTDAKGQALELLRSTSIGDDGKPTERMFFKARPFRVNQSTQHGRTRAWYPGGALRSETDYYLQFAFEKKLWSEDGTLTATLRPGLGLLPTSVEVFRNLAYRANESQYCFTTLMFPRQTTEPMPMILALIDGSPAQMKWEPGVQAPGWLSRLAARGYCVCAVRYRPAGKATFPTILADCKLALSRMRGLPRLGYPVDPSRVGVLGHRTGGHLAALLATTAEVAGLNDAEATPGADHLQAACIVEAPMDLSHLPKLGLEADDPNSWPSRFIGGQLSKNVDKVAQANPITHVTADDPPTLIIHGQQDGPVPLAESEAFQKALQDAGVQVELYIAPPQLEQYNNNGLNDALMDRVGDFFDRYLKPTPANSSRTAPREK